MSRKATILGLAAVFLIAVAAASYFGYTSTGPVDAASLVGPAAPRTGSHFKSPRVELSVETGDRIDWDFRDIQSPYREKDNQGDWVDGTHVLKEEYCDGGNHPQDYFIAGYKMADFGLTDVGDNGYLLRGRFTPPPAGSQKGWKHRPFHQSINPSGTEKVSKWHMRVRQRSRTDVDDSMPLAAPEERRQLRRPQRTVLLWPSIPLHRDTPGSGHANSRTTNRSSQYGSSGTNSNARS